MILYFRVLAVTFVFGSGATASRGRHPCGNSGFVGQWRDGELRFPIKQQSSKISQLQLNTTGTLQHGHDRRRRRTHESFVFTWHGSASGKIVPMNVSQLQALQAAGPLSLLRALKLCSSSDALGKVIQKARAKRRFSLHILGINSEVEPMMSWDRFLIGPLHRWQAQIVEQMGLEVAPFAGMNVTVLFNGFGHYGKLARRKGLFHDVASHEAQFAHGYSEKFAQGLYHNVVQETPDLVLAINPGFAAEPTLWWPTLLHLKSVGVPILATGYGAPLTLYKYNSQVHLVEDGHSVHRSQTWHQHGKQSKVSSDEVEFLVRSFRSEKGDAVHSYQPADMAQYDRQRNQPIACDEHVPRSHNGPSCGDRAGTTYMMDQVGYRVLLRSWNPFIYCDNPTTLDCTSNGIVFLLAPPTQEVKQTLGHPNAVFRKLLLDELQCRSHKAKLTCARKIVNETEHFESTHIDGAADRLLKRCKEH